MKKVFLVAVVLVVGFVFRQKAAEKKQEKLIGTWMMERAIPGGNARMHINLKPTGEFYVVVDAASMGRTAFGESAGNWEVTPTTLKMNFTKNGIPGLDMGQFYGGRIVTLDDTTLKYQSKDGMETWKRAR